MILNKLREVTADIYTNSRTSIRKMLTSGDKLRSKLINIASHYEGQKKK